MPEYSENPFGNALVPDMIADASIQLINDTFYCYATIDGYGRGLETSGPPVVWKSHDFVHWSFNGIYYPFGDNERYWAPSKAVQRNGKWYIYPTVNGYMEVAVADNPSGPFTPISSLLQGNDRDGIDAEVFIDDDGQAYVFWGRRHVARLNQDMRTVADIQTLDTRRKEYSEGPIFFKRNGIYYYLYTIGGDERYEYYYMMSRISPLGPYETPQEDCVSTTNVERGVFGPGHGCVFNDGDNYYLAFLEFGRNGTNRQTYVNPLEFNEDGTIRPVRVTLDGVGNLRPSTGAQPIKIQFSSASSVANPQAIRYFKDERCQRTEHFYPHYAFDHANGSRWMAAKGDSACWLIADLGQVIPVMKSEVSFVRPTQGHAYVLEGSVDGIRWNVCGGHADSRIRSPHSDIINQSFRYLRIRITKGIPGIWEWDITI
ncbi:MAG: family 43 glycosylhydrolase [Bacteroidaceae bacterium]|nr:family 43 glycosylhydrolase [Bacteroidaceae bacterium]